MRGRGKRRWAAVLCMTALIFSSMPWAGAGGEPPAASLYEEGPRNGMVRVLLSSLGQPSRLDITVRGTATMDYGTYRDSLPTGTKLSVLFSGESGQITVMQAGKAAASCHAFALRRHGADTAHGFLIAQSRSPGNLFPCDLKFSATSDQGGYRLSVVAWIYVEDYLRGVLPHEMGNASPLEALKAQAVVARTYTFRAMDASRGKSYDMTDTTSDQVYAGTPQACDRCDAAVEATRGIALMTGATLTAAYYSASNGGQTEAAANLWGNASYPYLTVKDDPYDLSNPQSRTASFPVVASGEQPNAALAALLQRKAQALSAGVDVKVTGVFRVTPHSPKYPPPSRLYTRLDFHVRIDLAGVPGSMLLGFRIFDELEKPLGMGINPDSNELWSVEAAPDGFRVVARRYGHGIGMSQRGAMRMATLGYTYDRILGFYFSGSRRARHTLTRSAMSPLLPGDVAQGESMEEEAADIAEDSLMLGVLTLSGLRDSLPLYQEPSRDAQVVALLPDGAVLDILSLQGSWAGIRYGLLGGYVQAEWLAAVGDPSGEAMPDLHPVSYGTVTGEGLLNLREGPGYDYPVKTQVQPSVILPVLSQEKGWCRVQAGLLVGFVRQEFLLISATWPGQAVDPAVYVGEVSSLSGLAWVRVRPETAGPVVAILENGDRLQVLRDDGAWAAIRRGDLTGYLPSAFIRYVALEGMQVPEATPAPADSLWAQVTTPSGSLNLRSSPDPLSPVLRTLPRFSQVRVLKRDELWCQVECLGDMGFAMTRYLSFFTQAEPPQASVEALVSTQAGSLNLRELPSLGARVLATIPRGAILAVQTRGEEWCSTTYRGIAGFVMSAYLSFSPFAPPPSPSETPYVEPGSTPGEREIPIEASENPLIPGKTPTTTPDSGMVEEEKPTVTPSAAPAQDDNASADPPNAQETPSWDAARDPTLVVLTAPASAFVQPDGQWLALHAGCSEQSEQRARMPRGDCVLVYRRGRHWCEVAFEGRRGFCLTAYLRFAQE